MDFKAEREKRGWSMQDVANRIPFKVSTINGLEKHGKGSERLKDELRRLYGIKSEAEALRENPAEYLVDDLISEAMEIIERAKRLEMKARKLKPRSLSSKKEAGDNAAVSLATQFLNEEIASEESQQPSQTAPPSCDKHSDLIEPPSSRRPAKKHP